MKSGKMGHVLAFFTLAIIISSPFVFAGFGDWWNSITGKASIDTTTATTTISAGSAPEICGLTAPSAQSPIEYSQKPVTFSFIACDADTAGNLRTDNAEGRFHLQGYGTNRTNTSCVLTGYETPNASANTYECTMSLEYYDNAATTWGVHVQIDDVDGSVAYASKLFTYNQLNSMNLTNTALDFGTIGTGDTNTESGDDMILNNMGNVDLQVNMTIYDMDLAGDDTKRIGATNFSIDSNDDGTACDDFGGWTNNTNRNVTGAIAQNGAESTELLGVCLEEFNNDLPAGVYTAVKDWIVGTHAVNS